MYIKVDYGFRELKNNSWSGAVDTLEKIEEAGKEEELMNFLEEEFVETPTETEVNDLLWFEDEYIFEQLGIKDEEDEEEEEEEVEE